MIHKVSSSYCDGKKTTTIRKFLDMTRKFRVYDFYVRGVFFYFSDCDTARAQRRSVDKFLDLTYNWNYSR